jgi:hypothetical protein
MNGNGKITLGDRLGTLFEDALAWVVESGVLGALFVLAILAAFLGR